MPIATGLYFKDKRPHLYGAAAAWACGPWVSWRGLTSGWDIGVQQGSESSLRDF